MVNEHHVKNLGIPRTKLCIPRTSFRNLLIYEIHANGLIGYSGRDKIIALIEDIFYWPYLKKYVVRIFA